MARILVVDDEIGIRELLSEILYDEGYTVEKAENAAQAREIRSRFRPNLVLLDIWMPDTDGVSLLKEWKSQGLLDMPVIMMSGHATIDTAVEATRIGAVDFLEKPITLQKLLSTVSNCLKKLPIMRSGSNILRSMNNNNSTINDKELNNIQSELKITMNGSIGSISLEQPLREARDAFERIYFEYHLLRDKNSMTKVSERTGLERTHLYRKLKQLGIESSRKRGS
ncbi:Sporulation initiation phosphotransferase F [Candidatus Kinetoplastibacterium sorsogonicusi]|uniref:Sporulation initiation phosphotransferase F n=1 Tax=Candidatus Kinetoplastidibacterium kentomonadis TaxID=1576550 RepID=A0A3S7JAM1_9PROT|nr:response regulator [Candidatus Kinetoplastibacterium sorsogonicusi]AWD32714.1 Sporulation initiation phosphotransferase F [Candidatus Kinetoplastibacterium sorsogonicusi]